MATASISCVRIADEQRVNHTAALFGINFPLHLEPFVFFMADTMCEAYNNGYWVVYALSNNGFYMAPHAEGQFHIRCENGYEGELSAEAFGTVVCLYAYSHLSFGDGEFAQTCAEHFHLLRECMLDRPEAGEMLRAID